MSGLVLLVYLSACERPDGGPTDRAPSDPGITLTSPADGAGSYGGAFDVAWEVSGFTLDERAFGGTAEEGHGHVHVYVDDALVKETADPGARVEGLLDGEHTISVRLADNDHGETALEDEVTVQVAHASVNITSPSEGARLDVSSVALGVAVEGLTLVDAIGEADVFGEGHFTVSVDGAPRDRGVDPLAAVATALTEGTHVVRVELVTNDGRPLDPPVYDETTVEVSPGARGVYWDRTAFGAPYDSATLPLSLTTTAFTLVERGGLPVDGQGHLHLFVDGVWFDETADPNLLLQNMAPGPHVFEARLVSNDDFELPILDRLWVDIAADRPDTLITYPGDTWIMGPSFDLTFTTENFTLDPAAMGGANAADVGHAQVWLDGVLHTETGEALVPFSGLLPGAHLVRVQLANNDRTAVTPIVYNEITVRVE